MAEVQSQIPTGTGRERLMQLAQPKEHKMIWITSCGEGRDRKMLTMGDLHPPDPRVTWGTQETLWPMNGAALNAKASGRLIGLATPKKNFQTGDNSNRLAYSRNFYDGNNRPEFMYSCGRSSVIWSVSPGAMKSEATGRVKFLAEHKLPPNSFQEDRAHYVFSCGRASPIWKVSRGAAGCQQRPRTESLAYAKAVNPHYLNNRDVQTKIPLAAMKTSASGRIESLSMAKSRPEGPFREPEWPVSQEAKKASPSGRSVELSKPKSIPDGYISARDVMWPVPRAARKAQATSRVDELSAPIVRASMDHVQFDPNAFIVKESALKGRCSRRVEELAQPLQR